MVIEEKAKQRSVILTSPTYSLGRDHKNAIVLNSSIVSRHHALLLRIPEPESLSYHYRIVDGNIAGTPSTNGIYINGKKCVSRDLQMGDVISIGGQVKLSYLTCTLDPHELDGAAYEDLVDARGRLNASDTMGNRPIHPNADKPTWPVSPRMRPASTC